MEVDAGIAEWLYRLGSYLLFFLVCLFGFLFFFNQTKVGLLLKCEVDMTTYCTEGLYFCQSVQA